MYATARGGNIPRASPAVVVIFSLMSVESRNRFQGFFLALGRRFLCLGINLAREFGLAWVKNLAASVGVKMAAAISDVTEAFGCRGENVNNT